MAKDEDLGRIIVGCKKGDAGSFSQLVDMYSGRCYGYFYRLTGDRSISDDLLSEFKRFGALDGHHRGRAGLIGDFDVRTRAMLVEPGCDLLPIGCVAHHQPVGLEPRISVETRRYGNRREG